MKHSYKLKIEFLVPQVPRRIFRYVKTLPISFTVTLKEKLISLQRLYSLYIKNETGKNWTQKTQYLI